MKSRQRIPLSIGLGAALLLGGCNLFQPRVPLRPALGDIVADYSTAAATLETMARAIEAKAAGNSPSAYVGGLADSIRAGDDQTFIAYFDPAVVTASGRTPPSEPWGPDREKQVFIHLPELSENSYSFAWLEDVQHPNDEDPAPNVKVLHRQYLLTATPEGGDPETLVTGYADLTFIKSKSGGWVIARWQDRFDPAVGPSPSSGIQSFSALRLGQ